MSFNVCTSQAIKNKAGAYANTTASTSNAILAEFCDQAEAEFSVATKRDWASSALWATVPAQFKNVIGQAVASRAAIDVITYDPTGYTIRGSEFIVDVLKDNFIRIAEQIKEADSKNYIFGNDG